MPVKSKIKTKKSKAVRSKTVRAKAAKPKVVKKLVAKSKMKAKAKPAMKFVAKPRAIAKSKTSARMMAKPVAARTVETASLGLTARPVPALRQLTAVVKKVVNPLVERRPVPPRTPRVHQFSYMKAPGMEHAFEVGDTVEVFCDHEKNRERVRGWVRGIVVQVDNKMVAVQFRSNVYLTDGWMVPDRILWYPVGSEHIRPVPGKKVVKKDFIPDY
jgi:hypothetical protein